MTEAAMTIGMCAFFSPSQKSWAVFFWVALAVLAARVVLHATVAEDAYITFRVIDQFTHGNGLRWNIDERVQVYTNPLWMLFHIPFYFFWENIEAITLLLSAACTLAAIGLSARAFPQASPVAVCVFILALAASLTFVDYSTSGLENPLTHVMFAWIGWIMLCAKPPRFWFWLSVATSLALVNRLDTAVFYFPIWAYLVYSRFSDIRWRQVVAGAVPIAAWESFSLFYYGFFFPNTKYAKLDTLIAQSEYFTRGTTYLLNLVATDPFSVVCLALAIIFAVRFYRQEKNPNRGCLLAVAAGIAAYAFYVFYVGGARQEGRFWSLPVFASLWLLWAMANLLPPGKKTYGWVIAACIASLLYPSSKTIYKHCAACFDGMAEPERADVLQREGWGMMLRATNRADRPAKDELVVMSRLGEFGYNSHRETIILDSLGIADTLLARLPSKHKDLRFAGHAWRAIPEGYAYARQTGDTSRMQPDLAFYYGKLRLMIAGDLGDSERVQEIIKFNLGAYDDARERFLESTR